MTYYHRSKQEALDAGEQYAAYFKTEASLVPNNGWVLVLYPIGVTFLDYPLAPLLEVAELRLPPTLRKPPAGRKPIAPSGGSPKLPRSPANVIPTRLPPPPPTVAK